MGDIADMMIDGTLDAITGEYIGRGHGYPRTLDKSLPWERGSGRALNATYGVKNYLNSRGIDTSKHRDVIVTFFPEENVQSISNADLSLRISKDFKEFKEHVTKFKTIV